MSYFNHLIFSLTCNILFIKIFNLEFNIYLFYLIISSFFFSIFPDIDHRYSLIGKKLYFFSYFINKKFGHRRFFHSFIFFIIIYILFFNNIFFVLNIYLIYIKYGFLIGFLSHIFIDMFTSRGVKFFWPLNINFKIYFFFFNNLKNINFFFIIIFFLSIFFDYLFCILYILIKNLYII